MRSILAIFLLLMIPSTCLFSQDLTTEITQENRVCGFCRPSKRGPRGPVGSTGPRGFIGPTGPTFSNSFGSFFTLLQGTPQIETNNPILFDEQHFPPVGSALTYTLGSGVFTINEDGYYRIAYGVSQDLTSSRVALAIDGVEQASTRLLVNFMATLTSIEVIIPIMDTPKSLSLINASTAAFQLQSMQGTISAYISIEKIAPL